MVELPGLAGPGPECPAMTTKSHSKTVWYRFGSSRRVDSSPMPLPSVLPFPGPLRALRAQLAPLAVPGHDVRSGPTSMFDSAGALGVTVEVPESEQGALALHAHLASSAEVSSMLVIDPAGMWAHGMMQALSDATGTPVDRLRVHSRGGLQVR